MPFKCPMRKATTAWNTQVIFPEPMMALQPAAKAVSAYFPFHLTLY